MAFRKGDKVSWNTPQGTTHGVVEEKRTEDFQHKGQTFRASSDDPVYVVRSDKSGETAAHHGSALTKNG
jgi:Hypervirulence associated proteins TUDOR domain